MQVESLHPEFDRLQETNGDKNFHAVYGCGCIKRPKACLVFMNPTARNVATDPSWMGIRAQWLGTKQVWGMLAKIGAISGKTHALISALKPAGWTPEFAVTLYSEVAQNGFYITNLSKSTQADAHALPDSHFQSYRELFFREMTYVRPQTIVLFGNQVSSVLLERPVKVSEECRKGSHLKIGSNEYCCWPTYYPVGQGMRNMPKAIANIRYALQSIKS